MYLFCIVHDISQTQKNFELTKSDSLCKKLYQLYIKQGNDKLSINYKLLNRVHIIQY